MKILRLAALIFAASCASQKAKYPRSGYPKRDLLPNGDTIVTEWNRIYKIRKAGDTVYYIENIDSFLKK